MKVKMYGYCECCRLETMYRIGKNKARCYSCKAEYTFKFSVEFEPLSELLKKIK